MGPLSPGLCPIPKMEPNLDLVREVFGFGLGLGPGPVLVLVS